MVSKGEFKVGAQIRAWRKKRNLIQKELAAAVGMDVSQLWSIENDRNSPSLRTLARIAKALCVGVPELLMTPDGEHEPDVFPAPPTVSEYVHVSDDDHRLIVRPENPDPLENELSRFGKQLLEALRIETMYQTMIPTSLPLQFPIVKTETGAAQLARAVRAYCDVGSAIIHDVRILFETHGVRILDADFPPGSRESMTLYSAKRRSFTVFLSKSLPEKPWRRDFIFLSEIGRIFLFAANSFETYRESATSRRFAHHFAASFLQPEQTIRTTIYSLHVSPDDWTWELLLRLKVRFGVSAHSFLIRLKELSLISRRKYESFMSKINSFRLKEPMPSTGTDPNRLGDLLALNVRANERKKHA